MESKKYVFGFMDETGLLHTPKTDRVFALAILKLHHPSYLHKAIIDFKNRKNFHQEMHFTDINDKNWRIYLEFIKIFFSIKECNFSVMVFDKRSLDLEKFFKGNHINAYNSYVSKIISENLDKGEYISIIADDISTPKSDNFEKTIKVKIKKRLMFYWD